MRCINEFIRKTSGSSSLIKSTPKKRMMITAIEKSEGVKASNSKEVPYGKKETT